MWQARDDDDAVDWKKRPAEKNDQTKGPHKDYEWNLEVALNFINKTKNSLPEGMKVAITGSQWLPKALVMISWMPARNIPMGNWANPIFLHQCRFAFGKELERVFNDYLKNIESFQRRILK